ncbi:hypothetical protein Poli38472_002478 [Pythium oligandrum]|uniref:Uncharacterized protein n=1 Tax=Pythium oligandrum TaxID=41045 RepID=A0A8K1CJT7_PYTOL|nr:hypothetical protein Poli38472_002478 [Pythium oligandrum]|eukprot:TMW63537.1 hypothetical protein Poli38472_002478 [Pythium oligandrum]
MAASPRHLIPFEDVATMPAPGMNYPVNVSFSPDGQRVAFLHSRENQLSRQLYALEVASKSINLLASPPNQGNTEGNLSLEEKLRRERQRQMGVGITSYSWSPSPLSQQILYPIQGDLYVQERPGAELRLLFDKTTTGVAGGAIDPQYSPDGKWIAFVQDKEVYIVSSEVPADGSTQRAVQITTGARGIEGRSNGLACFLTQEELSRFRGFWWSPDGTHIAFEEIDESLVPEFRIMHSGHPEVGPASQEDHRYPFAGGVNPLRRLGVVPVRHSEGELMPTPVWMDFANDETDFYISRVNWLPDRSLGVQRLNRLQDDATFYRFDPSTGKGSILIHETNPVWINAHYLFRNIETENKQAFRFIWASERTGFMHLYLYEYVPATQTAQLLGALTSGEWCVESIEGIDLAQGKVYICGTLDTPLERHLYVTSLFPGQTVATPVRLTGAAGMHSIVMDNACKQFVDVYSNVNTPPVARLYSVPTDAQIGTQASFLEMESSSTPLHTDVEVRVQGLVASGKLPSPQIISFPSRDGAVMLYGAVYMPDATIHGPGPYPTLVAVYGGPHVQRVANMWALTVDMRAQRFRDMGYVVLKVDNRGSFRRGSAFEGAIKNCMGTIEILDQQDGVTKLIQDGVTIADRVGMYGWSYGGYMSAISLMKAPETFKLAIAGAPVTSWDGYDTCYTERYMSTPQLNPEGYRIGSVMEAVSSMKDSQKLLLIHGLIDENVHFRHTARLINALISARKHYDLLLFPSERHSPRGLEDRIYMEQRIAEYVQAHL